MVRFVSIICCLFLSSPFVKSIADEGSDFEIQDDFILLKVAEEPLLVDPVDLEFDADGNAFVLEMPGYPFGDKLSRILLLTDTNQDGVYDNSTVYADKLGLADSFLPYKNGFLVAAPPYLLHVADLDADYRADKVDTLMGGFAKQNLQHNFNGLTYGLDNWIYAANGGNDGKPYWWGKPETALNLRGQDLRFNLETNEMELLGESSGGFGLAMDSYGRVFETHNLTHISHLVFPDKYLNGKNILPEHTLEDISTYSENGLARIYPIGEQADRMNHPEQSGYFSGACGVTYYGGGTFGEKYENTVWIADVVLNLIHVAKIEKYGASFSALRFFDKKEFLASSDRSFRPVNMSVGPDGSMFVLDMHREVIEHPEWIPDEIERTLDLNAGKNKGRIYKIVPKDRNIKFDPGRFRSFGGLVEQLQHPNQWVRNTAHRILLEKNWPDYSPLENLLASENQWARLHTLWILGNKKMLSKEQIMGGLQDQQAEIRENTLKIAELFASEIPSLTPAVASLLHDPDARVRMQAALYLSKLPDTHVDKELILKSLAAAARNTHDRWTIAALTLAAGSETTTLFHEVAKQKKPNVELLAGLALNADADFAELVNSVKAAAIRSEDKASIIDQIRKNNQLAFSPEMEQSLKALEKNATLKLLTAVGELREKLGMQTSPKFIAKSQIALKNVLNQKLPDSLRIEYLHILRLLPYEQKKNLLFACLENKQPLSLQQAAIGQLAAYQNKEIGEKIVAIWNDLSPQTRRLASDVLLYSTSNHDALLTGLENGTINIGEMNFDLERRRTLLWWTDDKTTKERAKKLFSDAGVKTRQEVIEQMQPALSLRGDQINGATVFTNTCASCHTYGNVGTEVGPNLTEINRKSKATIMHEILNPNASVDPKYINHSIETKNGVIHLGIVAAENDKNITIQKIGGEKVTIQKSNIKSFRSLGSSLMMEGFENALSHQEMADLLVFLQKGTR